MTAFTRTWNPAYEALPPDTENAKNGAERINETKVDARERLEVDHSMAGDADDGAHKKITLVDPLAAKPTQVNDETYIYSKDVSGTSEFFFEDELGNEIQLTSGGSLGLAGQALLGTLTGNVTGTLTGNASTANAWATGRTISLTGNITGSSGAWDGSGNISFATAIANDSVAFNAEIAKTSSDSSTSVGAGGYWTVPEGIYNLQLTGGLTNFDVQVNVNGVWMQYDVDLTASNAKQIVGNNGDVRVHNGNASAQTLYYKRIF